MVLNRSPENPQGRGTPNHHREGVPCPRTRNRNGRAHQTTRVNRHAEIMCSTGVTKLEQVPDILRVITMDSSKHKTCSVHLEVCNYIHAQQIIRMSRNVAARLESEYIAHIRIKTDSKKLE
uniref:Uncharacterized protein n=1 Tax=Lygus hesperus TaxID=30085 RepID=A0A146LI52_LYGHE